MPQLVNLLEYNDPRPADRWGIAIGTDGGADAAAGEPAGVQRLRRAERCGVGPEQPYHGGRRRRACRRTAAHRSRARQPPQVRGPLPLKVNSCRASEPCSPASS
eukprot:9199113-Pyramimonas_sp.AAC.2